MVATLASQFFIVWMIDKFGWFKNYDSSGIITAQDIVIMGKEFYITIRNVFSNCFCSYYTYLIGSQYG